MKSPRPTHPYIKVAGEWKYLYRTVDRDGDTIDFLLRAKKDCATTRCFLERAIDLHGVPEKIAIDKSGANTAAIKSIQTDSGANIEVRQISCSTTSSGKITGRTSESFDPCLPTCRQGTDGRFHHLARQANTFAVRPDGDGEPSPKQEVRFQPVPMTTAPGPVMRSLPRTSLAVQRTSTLQCRMCGTRHRRRG